MRAFSRKQLTIMGVATALVVLFFGGIFLPLRHSLATIKNEQRQYTIAVSQASADVSKLPVLSDQLAAMRKQVGDFSSRIPSSRRLGEFLQSVAKIMNEQSLQGQLIQPGEPVKTKAFQCIPVDIQCEGTLRQLFGLVRSLEETSRTFRLEHLELSTDRTFSGKVGLHARVYIYYKGNSEAEI
jgi:Tfp pilus assembly protein PilO